MTYPFGHIHAPSPSCWQHKMTRVTTCDLNLVSDRLQICKLFLFSHLERRKSAEFAPETPSQKRLRHFSQLLVREIKRMEISKGDISLWMLSPSQIAPAWAPSFIQLPRRQCCPGVAFALKSNTPVAFPFFPVCVVLQQQGGRSYAQSFSLPPRVHSEFELRVTWTYSRQAHSVFLP